MRTRLAAAAILLLSVAVAHAQKEELRARITARPVHHTYPADTPWEIRVQIENVGTTPFFVRRHLSNDDPWAGFTFKATKGPKHAHGTGWGWSGHGVNALAPGAQKGQCTWVLLFPGDNYGATIETKFAPSTMGVYTVKASYFVNPSDETANFEYPVLPPQESLPFKVTVTQRGP